MSKGANTKREVYPGCCYGQHAEMAAIKKLRPSYKSNNKIVLKLIVVRVDGCGNLKNSMPCEKCLIYLSKIRGYKIKYVYYSINDGSIVRVRFTDLLYSDNIHISRRFK